MAPRVTSPSGQNRVLPSAGLHPDVMPVSPRKAISLVNGVSHMSSYRGRSVMSARAVRFALTVMFRARS